MNLVHLRRLSLNQKLALLPYRIDNLGYQLKAGQVLASTLGGDYSTEPSKKPMCGCTAFTHEEVCSSIPKLELKSIPQLMEVLEWKTPDGCPSCRSALNYYLLCAWPGEYKDDPPVALHQRTRPRQYPEGRHLFSRAAHLGRGHQSTRIAGHRRRSGEIPGSHRKNHRGPAHRPARCEKGRPAENPGGFERSRFRLRPCLRQILTDGEDLCRQGVVPVWHPGLYRAGHQD